MTPAGSRRLVSGRIHHVGPAELEADEDVEKGDEEHRYHEEQEGGQLEGVADDDPLDGAHDHVGMTAVADHAELQGLR